MRLWFGMFANRKGSLDEEIQTHIRMAVQDRLDRGETPEQAQAGAMREFGNVPLVKEVTREKWGWLRLEHLAQDLRFALRQLRKSPGFTIAAVVTLALGLGAASAIFTVVDGVILSPLPYPHPERILWVGSSYKGGPDFRVIRSAQFRFLQEHSKSMDSLALNDLVLSAVNLSGGSEPEQVATAYVSADFFRVLGVVPAAGRFFTSEEDSPSGACAAIITDSLWRTRYNGDKSILRNPITVNGARCSVVGVLPSSFRFHLNAKMFMPIRVPAVPRDLAHYYGLLVRLKPGVTMIRTRAELTTLFSQFKLAHSDLIDDGEIGFEAGQYRDALVGDVRSALWLLCGAVLLLLLIACVNVAHLQVARAASRTKEMAVRAALGASPLRLARQLIAESCLLTLAGAVWGLLLAYVAVPLLLHLSHNGLPRATDISVNLYVVAFAFATSALTVLLFGTAPALSSSRVDANTAMKSGSHCSTPRRIGRLGRDLLIGTEVALSLILLTGAVLLMRSFVALERIDPGFDARDVLTFRMSIPPRYTSTSRMWGFEGEILGRLDALPGVVSAASATSLPLEAGPDMPGILLGQSRPVSINPAYRPVSPDYFSVLDIPIVRGRFFNGSDTNKSFPVAIINAALARDFFPDRDPIGQRLQLGAGLGAEYSDAPRTIVGVVGDVRETALSTPASITVFIPRSQIPDALTTAMNRVLPMSWAIKTKIPPAQLTTAIRQAILAVDADQPIAELSTMEQVMAEAVDRQRFILVLMTVFAALATVVAAVGIYGVVNFQMHQRERELGIRLALGALPLSLARMVTLQGLRPIVAGILAGTFASLALAKVIRALLFDTSPTDPVSLAASAVALAALAGVSCYWPARRALFMDPVRILREE
jgi:putative ABC transport system permease protein